MRVLDEADYAHVPWKNGLGSTSDLVMRPDAAGHDDFDLRISRSPIVTEGPFSSFPGIDRQITLIEGRGLELVFRDRILALQPGVPASFDSVLAPQSRLPDGPVTVINVMTRRGVLASQVDVASGAFARRLDCPPKGLLAVYQARGECIAAAGADIRTVRRGQTLLLDGAGRLDLRGSGDAFVLIARIVPATG